MIKERAEARGDTVDEIAATIVAIECIEWRSGDLHNRLHRY